MLQNHWPPPYDLWHGNWRAFGELLNSQGEWDSGESQHLCSLVSSIFSMGTFSPPVVLQWIFDWMETLFNIRRPQGCLEFRSLNNSMWFHGTLATGPLVHPCCGCHGQQKDGTVCQTQPRNNCSAYGAPTPHPPCLPSPLSTDQSNVWEVSSLKLSLGDYSACNRGD